MVRGFCSALILLVASSCSTYRIEPPQTEAGRICARQCDVVQNQCFSQAQLEADAEAGACSSQQKRVDEHCDGYPNAEDRRHCQAANQRPPICSSTPATGHCREPWELCVLGCGGRLIRR